VYSMTAAFARRSLPPIITVAAVALLAACTNSSAASDDPRLARLTEDRRAIWEAWFSNDSARLEQLLPNSVIAINGGDTTWQDRSAVLAGAAAFAKGGGKLVSLSFPKTEKQIFGDVAILYSTYVAQVQRAGKTSELRGRATEIFVWKNGVWQNAGWHLDAGC
jgi:Domain of unknown function (DUF4440)